MNFKKLSHRIAYVFLAVILIYGCSNSKKMSNTSFVESKVLMGVYNLLESDEYVLSSLELALGGIFNFFYQRESYKIQTKGFWSIKSDTLIFNSDLDKTNLPISLNQKESLKSDSIVFTIVTDKAGRGMYDASIYINGDMQHQFMPAFNESTFAKSYVKSFRFGFSDSCFSDWFNIKNKAIAEVKAVLDVDINLNQYFFMKDKKYIYKDSLIISINKLEPDTFKLVLS